MAKGLNNKHLKLTRLQIPVYDATNTEGGTLKILGTDNILHVTWKITDISITEGYDIIEHELVGTDQKFFDAGVFNCEGSISLIAVDNLGAIGTKFVAGSNVGWTAGLYGDTGTNILISHIIAGIMQKPTPIDVENILSEFGLELTQYDVDDSTILFYVHPYDGDANQNPSVAFGPIDWDTTANQTLVLTLPFKIGKTEITPTGDAWSPA